MQTELTLRARRWGSGLFILAAIVGLIATAFLMLRSISQPAHAAFETVVTGLYPTGVDNSGNFLSSGKKDPHWTLTSVDNPANGDPHCQKSPWPRPATIIQHGIVGPAEGGTIDDAKKCAAPGKDLNGQYTLNDVLRDGAIWHYQSTFNIDGSIVPNSVSLRVSGWGDDMFRVVINGHIATGWSTWHGTSQNRNYDDDVFTIPQNSNFFVSGQNTIEIQVLSVWEKDRFKISKIEVLSAYGEPHLRVNKTASASTMTVGQPYNYTLKVTNTGTNAGPTSGVITVTDTIPSFFAIGTLPAGCSKIGQVVTCTTNAVLQPNNASSFAQFVIPITPTSPSPSVTNTAYAYGGGDTVCATAASTACNSSATVAIVAPELRIVKTASSPSMTVGVPASYTLTISNQGTAPTSGNIVVSDVISPSLNVNTASLPSDCSYDGGTRTVTCMISGSIAAGANTTRNISVTPIATGAINNIAYVRGGGDPVCLTSATNTDLPVRCIGDVAVDLNQPQISVTKSAGVPTAVRGVPFNYNLTIRNTGTAATTTPITVTDFIANDLDLNVGSLPGNCSYDSGLRKVTCTITPPVNPGASVAITLSVTSHIDGGIIENTATAFGGGDVDCGDEVSAGATSRCHGSVTLPATAPQLGLTKTASATAVRNGDTLVYTLHFANSGSAPLTATATIHDDVPAGLTIGNVVSNNPMISCSVSGQVITCAVASGFANGAAADVTVEVTPAGPGTFTNHATTFGGGDGTCVDLATADATTRCNGDAPVVTASRYPILNVEKTASAPILRANQLASYTIRVTNQGPAPLAATSAPIVVRDTLPAGFTIGTLPADCVAVGQTVTCVSNDTLQPNDVASYIEFVIPFTPTVTGVDIPNTAYASGGGSAVCDIGSTNCSSTANVDVVAPEILITKSASTNSMTIGVPATYTLTVTNQGATATDDTLVIADQLPAEVDIVSASLPTDCIYISGTRVVRCDYAGTLAPGAQTSYSFDVTPNANVDDLENIAVVRGGGDGFCAHLADRNIFDQVELPARCIASVLADSDAPRLTISKSQTVTTTARQGQTVDYTLTVQNDGVVATPTATTIHDTLPAGVELVTSSLPGNCAYDSNSRIITCILAAGIAPGANASVSFNVTVTAGSGIVSNLAYITGGGDQDCTNEISALATSHCYSAVHFSATAPVLNILKFASVTQPNVGQTFVYQIMIENIGNMPTDAITNMSDDIPQDLEILSVSSPGATCSSTGNNVSCAIASGLNPGGRVFVTAEIRATKAGSYLNTAYTYGGGDGQCVDGASAVLNSRCHWSAGAVVLQLTDDPDDPDDPENPENPNTPVSPVTTIGVPNTGRP